MASGQRQARGRTAYHRGRVAEEAVALHYERRGHRIDARRWRGRGGEIDLVARDSEGLVFIEVKAAATHGAAATQLGGRQIRRLSAAAEEYLGGEPRGLLTPRRGSTSLWSMARGQSRSWRMR